MGASSLNRLADFEASAVSGLAERRALCEIRCYRPRDVGDTERAAGVSPDWLMIVGIFTVVSCLDSRVCEQPSLLQS